MKVINRIKKSDEFLLTIKKGHSYSLGSFVVHIRQTDLGYTRVGISVSSKLGNAVTRNKIKRQIRAMCRELIHFDKQSLDVVIIAKNPYLERDYAENKLILINLFSKQAGFNL